MQQWSYGIVEWLWDKDNITIYMPEGAPETHQGSYQQVAQILSTLGQQGWEVASSTGVGNWILWTLKRPA